MVLQYGIKLAFNLISAHFGDLVARVCDCLLCKGTLTLPELIRYTELPHQQVQNCLLVLIQHNCVQAFSIQKEGGFGVAPRVITQYTVIFENILHRMRFCKFLAIVSEELEKECEELLEGLLQHGRLTLEQIILRAISKQNEGNPSIQDSLRARFVKLVKARYVERCPASEPFLAPPSEDETPKVKRGSKLAKLIAERETVEQRAITLATPSDGERFAISIDSGTDVTTEAKTGGSSTITVGEKRKHKELEMDSETVATICEKEVLWRANFEEFIRRLRHKACVANVRSRLDDGAGTVLNAMLEATRRTEKKVKTKNSAPLSMDTILEEVIKSEEGRSMTLEHVRATLGQLGCHSSGGGTEEGYSVDLGSIIEIAQNDEVESIVLKRYGKDAYKIFRLLSKKGHVVETDKISDATFVDKKETLKILYNLWKNDYLHMERLTQQAGPQARTAFFLWKVNKQPLWELILNEMYHAALNLRQRVVYELEQEHEILLLPKEKRVGIQGTRFERIRKVKVLMESSLMKLDDALMLFHDF